MADYKWPSKVFRYKIMCPFLRLFVAKYEAQVDWSRGGREGRGIQSADDIVRHIKTVFLKKLRSRVDPKSENSHFCRKLPLEQMLENPAPHLDQARSIARDIGKEAAYSFLLDQINSQKRACFEEWWRYVTRDNPVLAANQVFQYLLLAPIFDSSPASCTRAPVALNAEAVLGIYEQIRVGRLSPTKSILRAYAELVVFGDKATSNEMFGSECGWIEIQRGTPQAASKVAAASAGSGWCVSSSFMAEHYLRQSDFHILLESGRAVAALRVADEKILEVQGKSNRDPGPWWARILLRAQSLGLSFKHRRDEASFQGARLSKKIQELENDLLGFVSVLRDEPANVQFAPEEWAAEETRGTAMATAWSACISADPLCVGLVPRSIRMREELQKTSKAGWLARVLRYPEEYLEIPQEFRTEETGRACFKGWIERMRRAPHEYANVPEWSKTEELTEACREGWVERMRRAPHEYANVPERFKTKELYAACQEIWAERIRRDPRAYADVPSELRTWQMLVACPQFLIHSL